MRHLIAIVALAMFLATPPSLFAKSGKTKKAPVIEMAMVMYEDEGSSCVGPLTTLTIVGQKLAPDEGEDPTLTLATYPPLTLCDVSASEIV